MSSLVRGRQKGGYPQESTHRHDSLTTTTTPMSNIAAAPEEKSDVSAKISDLNTQIAAIESRLQSSSVSEASRYALKKEMAKARANVLRLKRTALP